MRNTYYYNYYKPFRGMDLNLDRLHDPSTRIARSHTDQGGCRSVYKNCTLYQFKRKHNPKRCGRHILTRNLETPHSTHRNYFGYGYQVFRRILGIVMQVTRHKTKNVYWISLLNRWPNGKNQPDARRIPTQFRQLRSGRLGSVSTTSRTRYNNSTTNAHGMSPFYANYKFHLQTEWIKEGEAQNPGAGLYAHRMQVTHQHAKKALQQTREEMSKYYDRKGPQQPDIKVGDLVMINAKNIHTKRPTKEVKSKNARPVQSIGSQGRRARFQVSNIAEVGNRSNIARFIVGALLSINTRR